MPLIAVAFAFVAAHAVAFIIGGIILAATMVIGVVMRPKSSAQNTANTLTQTLDPEAYRVTVLGECPCGNDIRYWEVHGRTHFDQVIAAATHRIEAFGKTYIEGVELSFSGNLITGTLAWGTPGQVGYQASTNRYANGTSNYVYWKTNGVTATTIGTTIGAGNLWTSASSFTDCAFYAFVWNADPKYLPSGIPSQVCQVVKGSPVYDPRRDTTVGGSGSHRANDNTTWEYSPTESDGTPIGKNNALQMLRYLLGWWVPNVQTGAMVQLDGRGVDPADIDYAGFIAAANNCVTAGFYSSVALSTGDTHTQNEATIASGAGGVLLDVGGLWTYRVAVDDTASIAVALTDDDLAGPVQWIPKTSISTLYNQVRGNFTDPSTGTTPSVYQSAPYPTIIDSTYLAQDGVARNMQLDLKATLDPALAQKLARIALNKNRLTGQLSASFKYTILKAQLYDCVTLTFSALGFSSKLFRIVKMAVNPMGAVDCILQEEASSVYTGGTVNTYVPASSGVPYNNQQALDIGTVTLTSVQLLSAGTTAYDGIVVSWSTAPTDTKNIDVWYKITGATNWQQINKIDFAETTITIPNILPATNYTVQVRANSISGILGTWESNTLTTGTYTTATQNQTFYQSTDPSPGVTVNDGAFWTNTTNGSTYLRSGGAWIVIATQTIRDGDVLYTSTTPGAFSFTVPISAPGFVWIEIWGPGGQGGGTHGGGGGGYVKHHMAVTAGTTVIAGTLGTPGISIPLTAPTATTVTSPALTANNGGSGASGAGTAGTASGGNLVNTSGEAGDTGATGNGGAGANGGARQTTVGMGGNSPGGGGHSYSTLASVPGGNPKIIITAKTT